MIRKVTSWISSTSVKYGPAWIVTVQTLGWITFFIIYIVLATVSIDLGTVARKWTTNADYIALADAGGTAALAFALNRLLSPLRIVIALAVVPRIADPVNALLRPMWAKWFGGGGDNDKQGSQQQLQPGDVAAESGKKVV
ncbi:hypothetical protein DFJ73DRAFT_823247 [Zopfochytrium polystomum]|nr:hypothetical protein DFJ73DRAFT_823247 [Zopfochytrium polystomum]